MLSRLLPFTFELHDAQGRKRGEGRARGLHLSEIIYHMRTHALGEKLEGTGGETRMAAGFALETMFEESWAKYFGQSRPVIRPNETEVDGVFMNADGINVDDGFLEDTKATWKSRRKLGVISQSWGPVTPEFTKNFWHWLVQIKAYARAYGTRKARLLIFFLMGDYTYRPPHGEPHIVNLEFEFTQEELDSNWQMLINYAKENLGHEVPSDTNAA